MISVSDVFDPVIFSHPDQSRRLMRAKRIVTDHLNDRSTRRILVSWRDGQITYHVLSSNGKLRYPITWDADHDKFTCPCPDNHRPCKHILAVAGLQKIYGVR